MPSLPPVIRLLDLTKKLEYTRTIQLEGTYNIHLFQLPDISGK